MAGSASKTRTKTVPVQKLKKVPANSKVKKKVPVRKKPDTNDDEEFEDLEDPEMVSENVTPRSDYEFKLEMDRLRQRLTKLESHRVTQQSQKRTEVPREVTFGSYREPSPPIKSMNPVKGKMLGTFNGRTDLDTFLVRFRTCSRNFKWSETEKVFYLMKALPGPAKSLVKEVGDKGTLEDIMKLLQSRFGNRCKLEKFRTELKNRRRGPDDPCRNSTWISADSEPTHTTMARMRSSQRYSFEIFL